MNDYHLNSKIPKHFSDSPFCHFKEDILGGHSAVGNITLRILNDLACQEKGLKTQEQIQVWFFCQVDEISFLSKQA